jgi:hypothetical protein
LPFRVLHFLPCCDTTLEKVLRAGQVGGGVGDPGLRPFHFRRLLFDFCRRAGNLEPHEHVTTLHALAFAEMNL